MPTPPTFSDQLVGAPPKKKTPVWVWILAGALIFCCCCSILPALLFPVFSQARREAKRAAALSDVKQVAICGLMYSNDFDDQLPYVQDNASAIALLQPYTKTPTIFQSPTVGGEFQFNLNVGGVPLESIDSPNQIPMWIEALPDPNLPAAVAFIDGSAKSVRPEEMPDVKKFADQQFERPETSQPLPPNYVPPPP